MNLKEEFEQLKNTVNKDKFKKTIAKGDTAIASIENIQNTLKMHKAIGMNVPSGNPYKYSIAVLQKCVDKLNASIDKKKKKKNNKKKKKNKIKKDSK